MTKGGNEYEEIELVIKRGRVALLLGVLLLPCKVKAADYAIENEETLTTHEDGIRYTLSKKTYDSWEEAADDIGEIAREFGVKRDHKKEWLVIPVEIESEKRDS